MLQCFCVKVTASTDGQKLELLKLTPAKQSANFDLLANVSGPDLNWAWPSSMIETLKVKGIQLRNYVYYVEFEDTNIDFKIQNLCWRTTCVAPLFVNFEGN